MKHSYTPTRGQVILVAMVFFAFFLAISSALVRYVVTYSTGERHIIASTQALALAEAGIDQAAYQLNQNVGYAGETNTALGNGTFTTTVSSIDASTKRVTSTASVVTNGSTVTRTVAATLAINSTIVSFRFGVQVGEGGVTMGNNSQVNGNIYSNGSISGGGTVTGDATVAGGSQPDEAWTTYNTNTNFGDTTADSMLAEAFTPSSTILLNKVSLYLKKVGTPSDLTIKIYSDSSGKPSSTVLATGSLAASAVGTSYSFIDGTLTSTPQLSAGQKYWIVVTASKNVSNYFVWGSDNTNGYSGGTGMYSNSGWQALGSTLDFETFSGGSATSISGITVQGNGWAHSLSSCTINGDAYYQSISSCTVSGTKHPGSADSAPAAFPVSTAQVQDWETAAGAGSTIAGPDIISGSNVTLGPNVINGDLMVTNGATVTLAGPVWVKGNITISNNAIVRLSSALGSSSTVIVADSPGNTATKGTVIIANNVTIAGNGTSGSFPMILTTNSSSGAIQLSNNGASVILYAPNGTVSVSNGAAANQITAYQLSLSNNSSVNYINGLQSESFSNGPGGSWTFVPGSYSIVK